jgi:ABC-2 type transport system permease protein
MRGINHLGRTYLFLMREHGRQLDFLVFTLLFPALFFLIFGVPEASDFYRAQTLLASFNAFGVIGVVLFQSAVMGAQTRHSSWERYLHTVPIPPLARLGARLLMVTSFACLSIVSVSAIAWRFTALEIDLLTWLKLSGVLLIGSVPFALVGYLLGGLASPKGVVPLANLVYLCLSYAGGLWFPPQLLPEVVQQLSIHLPSRKYAEMLWDVALYRPLNGHDVRDLVLQTLFFLALLGGQHLWKYRPVRKS